MSRGNGSEEEVSLVSTVIDSSYFDDVAKTKGRSLIYPPVHTQGIVLGGLVLVVKVGNHPVRNLSEPVQLFFKYNKMVENPACVFWDDENKRGQWSKEGCNITDGGSEFICSCDHLSFFAVLVNPELKVDKNNAVNLSYISYAGSALSVVFTFISLIIYICLHRQRPENAICLHMHLTGALLCLHLIFLLGSFLEGLLHSSYMDDWRCSVLGFFLHWSLLATFTWSALEGFHLYLLLVRVFNIYVRRYLLKLSLVGWGLPTLVAVVCAISGVYGKYTLTDSSGQTSVAHMCWMSSQFPHMLLVSYITTVAFPCLVILYNSCILGVVVFKLWGVRRSRRGFEKDGSWNKNRGKWTGLWKDCATVVGLSCVLGLPWGLASTTYILPGIYVFTIFNSLQGVFVFLWSVALMCKPRSDDNSSTRDHSSQKMMTTSFNN
ncbi:adhesion G protein-coupled receptor G3-like isoform X2 [Mugil cephalus]|nr:adhesion G protein-coupled receptor G3-like isoform X2 [Mugil cephalus]